MPQKTWTCGICKKSYTVDESEGKPTCNTQQKCKNGTFVNEVKQQLVSYNHETKALGFGYKKDIQQAVSKNYDFSGGKLHKPSGVVYLHGNNKWAIAPDGSTHSSGKACWKAFKNVNGKWKYWGSFDGELNQVNRGSGIQEDQPPKS